jgi:hypothetical protein
MEVCEGRIEILFPCPALGGPETDLANGEEFIALVILTSLKHQRITHG